MLAVVVNIFLNLTFVWFIGAAGLAVSTALCSYLQVAFLLFYLRKKFQAPLLRPIVQPALKTAAATIIMTLAALSILYLARNLPQRTIFNVIKVAVVVITSAAVYIFAAKLLKIEELKLLTARKNKHFENV